MKTSILQKTAAVIALLMSLLSVNAADALDTAAVAKHVGSIVPKTRIAELGASTAVISIKYNGSQIEEATVFGAGETGLAIELHKSINWRKFPMTGESKATYIVASDGRGNLEVSVR